MQTIASIRHYEGEYSAHEHGHAQLIVGMSGRLEMEVCGHAAYVDSSCGLLVPAGLAHLFLAHERARMWVLDAAPQRGTDRLKRFAVEHAWRRVLQTADPESVLQQLADAPRVLARRGLDLARLDAAIDAALHEPWSTPRMAALFFLSAQRFHARLLELTGLAPGAYLRERRLDRATALLRAGCSLDASALQVGYASASSLAFALRRERRIGARGIRAD